MRVVFLGRSRVLWRQLLLEVVTLGVYRRVWLYRVNKEVDGHEALGINHTGNLVALWAAAGALVWAALVPAIGLDTGAYAVAVLFLIPTSIVQLQTARRGKGMLASSDVKHGNPTVLWLVSLVPIFGAWVFLLWEQGRLNRFWAYERAHPGRGLEVDVELGSDPRFLVELDRARKESYYAGSRFDRRRNARRARWTARLGSWQSVQAERRAVREAGGSTPILPFLRPQRPPHLRLKVTCGRCDTGFAIERDPAAETPIVCPKCGLAEVLPALWENPLAPAEKAAVPTIHASCPKCKTEFNAVRNLFGPTELVCPNCGRRDVLDQAPATPRGKGARA